MSKPILVYLSLGSNLGNRIDFLNQACDDLKTKILKNFRVSGIFESEPLLKMQQPNYYNIVVSGETKFKPHELLENCQLIEKNLGRKRLKKWGPRNIDLDILSYNDITIDTEELKIPHPEIEKRGFVLLPLLEISPKWKHPKSGIDIKVIWDDWLRFNKENLPKKLRKKINLDN